MLACLLSFPLLGRASSHRPHNLRSLARMHTHTQINTFLVQFTVLIRSMGVIYEALYRRGESHVSPSTPLNLPGVHSHFPCTSSARVASLALLSLASRNRSFTNEVLLLLFLFWQSRAREHPHSHKSCFGTLLNRAFFGQSFLWASCDTR